MWRSCSTQRICGLRAESSLLVDIYSLAKYSTSYNEAHWEPADQGQESTLRGNYAASVVQPNVQLLEHNENRRIKGRKHSNRDHETSVVQQNVLLPVLEHIENLRIEGRKHSTQGSWSILSSAKYSTSYNEAHWEPVEKGQESTLREYYAASVVQPNDQLLEHNENLRIKGRKHSTRRYLSLAQPNIPFPTGAHGEPADQGQESTLRRIMEHL